jgi:signal transduction histidine kinase
VIAVLTAISVFIYIPFSLLRGYYVLGILQGVDVICVLSVLWLNYIGYHKLARHIYIFVINSFVLINSCFIGYESRVQDFFYIAYIVPFLLFSVKDYRNIVVGVLISILFFNIYQSIYPHFIQYNLDINTQHMISNINLWMKFVLFGTAIYILSYYNLTTETELALTNKKLEEQAVELKRSNNDLEQFAAIISHDLKAPVRNVSSFMTLLIRRYGGALEPDALNFIELSKNSTDRMARQIDDLLAYSKLGRDLPATGIVDVNMLIETIRVELGEKIRERNAALIVERHLPIIRNVHSSMIHHILQNLIVNGIKFNTKDKPEIRINCTEHADKYVFYVKDNGIGIEDGYQDKLFQMFKRLHTDSEFEGTGIGLAVCKKIVEYYGGTIWLESTKGEGTCFYFALPKPNVGYSQALSAKYTVIKPYPLLAAS